MAGYAEHIVQHIQPSGASGYAPLSVVKLAAAEVS